MLEGRICFFPLLTSPFPLLMYEAAFCLPLRFLIAFRALLDNLGQSPSLKILNVNDDDDDNGLVVSDSL